jgi:hypothetical protein
MQYRKLYKVLLWSRAMIKPLSAGPYVDRRVDRACSGRPTYVIYQSKSYSGSDVQICAYNGIGQANILTAPARVVAFVWGNDNVDVAAIQNNPEFPSNPYADLYSIRNDRPTPTAKFNVREMDRLASELDLAARLVTHKPNPTHGQRFMGKPAIVRNSYDVPLVVRRINTFPESANLGRYVRQSSRRLGIDGSTEVGLVFAYGTTAGRGSGQIEPAADIVAIPKTQPTPKPNNPEFNMHTVVGDEEWQPAGICRLEAPVVAESTCSFAELGLKKFLSVETA